jgi:tetratricopeptide (TPR) repeat protein
MKLFNIKIRLKLKFPHINRIIDAAVPKTLRKPFLFSLLFALLWLNISQSRIRKQDEEQIIKREIMQNPTLSLFHEKLAQYYTGVDAKEAEKEYRLADELYLHPLLPITNNQILGIRSDVYSSPWHTWQNLLNLRMKLEDEEKFWQELHRQFPEYQYANLKIAILNWQLGNKERSVALLDKILQESPENKTAADLLEKIN